MPQHLQQHVCQGLHHLSGYNHLAKFTSSEPSQRTKINLFTAILFLASCSMPITISQKVNITGLGWIGNVKCMIDRKKKSHGGSSIQCEEFFSLCSYAERTQGPKFPRTNTLHPERQTNKQKSICNHLQCIDIWTGPQQASNTCSLFYN